MLTVKHFLSTQGKGDRDGAAFARKHKTLQQVWLHCERSDWMLWILDRTKPMPDKMSRKFACWCARNTPISGGKTVWDLITDERARNAIVVAERHADGKATDEELAAASSAAWDAARAAASSAASAAAWDAAWAAAWDAQCREIRRLIPNIDRWIAPKKRARKTVRK